MKEIIRHGMPLISVGTDQTIQYSLADGILTQLDYHSGSGFFTRSYTARQPLRFVEFPEVMGCHLVISIDRESNHLWCMHVSTPQRDQKTVPAGYLQPPPPYAQILAEKYSQDGVGISPEKQVDFFIIDKAGSFNEAIFRDALGKYVGNLNIIRPENATDLKYTPVDIFYDLKTGTIFFIPESESIYRPSSLNRQLELRFYPRTAEEAKLSSCRPNILEVVSSNETLTYLEQISHNHAIADLFQTYHYKENILSILESDEAFTKISHLLDEQFHKFPDDENQAIFMVGFSILSERNALAIGLGEKKDNLIQVALALITFSAKRGSKQAAYFLAELYANRRDEGYDVIGDEEKAMHFLSLAATNGSATAERFLDSGERWFIEPEKTTLPMESSAAVEGDRPATVLEEDHREEKHDAPSLGAILAASMAGGVLSPSATGASPTEGSQPH